MFRSFGKRACSAQQAPAAAGSVGPRRAGSARRRRRRLGAPGSRVECGSERHPAPLGCAPFARYTRPRLAHPSGKSGASSVTRSNACCGAASDRPATAIQCRSRSVVPNLSGFTAVPGAVPGQRRLGRSPSRRMSARGSVSPLSAAGVRGVALRKRELGQRFLELAVVQPRRHGDRVPRQSERHVDPVSGPLLPHRDRLTGCRPVLAPPKRFAGRSVARSGPPERCDIDGLNCQPGLRRPSCRW